MAKLYFRYGTVNSGKTMNLLAVAHNYRTQNKKVCILKPKIDTRTEHKIYSRTGMEINADIIIDEKIDLIGLIQDKYKQENSTTDRGFENSSGASPLGFENSSGASEHPSNDSRIPLHSAENSSSATPTNVDENPVKDNFRVTGNVDLDCILVDEAQFLDTRIVMQLRIIASFMNIPVICYGLKTNYLGELFIGSDILLSVSDAIEEIKTTCQYCNKKAIMNLKLNNGKPVTEGDGSIELGFEDKYIPTCFKHYFTS